MDIATNEKEFRKYAKTMKEVKHFSLRLLESKKKNVSGSLTHSQRRHAVSRICTYREPGSRYYGNATKVCTVKPSHLYIFGQKRR